MPNNLFVKYCLADDKNREQVEKAVQALGNSTPFSDGFWYINSPQNSQEALDSISRAVTKEDEVIVINTSNDSCTWLNIGEKEARRISQNWKM